MSRRNSELERYHVTAWTEETGCFHLSLREGQYLSISSLPILSLSSFIHISLQFSCFLFSFLHPFLLHPFFSCHPASPLAVRLTVAMVMIQFLISVMWCLIRFHWGVCHYFISRAIWWASVSSRKSLCLRGEQRVHRQQSVKAPMYVYARVLVERTGTRLSETEREICGAVAAVATLYFLLGAQY